jgi:hypothetical protein
MSGKLTAIEGRIRALETQLHDERRRLFLEGAIRQGQISPGERESVERAYDADPTAVVAIVSSRPATVLQAGRNYFADEDVERTYRAEAAGRLGIATKDLI